MRDNGLCLVAVREHDDITFHDFVDRAAIPEPMHEVRLAEHADLDIRPIRTDIVAVSFVDSIKRKTRRHDRRRGHCQL
jgi:hypothetical protein